MPQVEEAYGSVVQPFIRKHKQRFRAPQGMGGSRGVYRWAVSVVAGYSFELGEDNFQVRTHGAHVKTRDELSNK